MEHRCCDQAIVPKIAPKNVIVGVNVVGVERMNDEQQDPSLRNWETTA